MKLIIIMVLALALASPVVAEETQHCYNGNSSDILICEFHPSGRVNLTEGPYPNGEYFSFWFTHAEWLRYKANPKHSDVYQRPTNNRSEAEAQAWHTQAGCEADGFIWRDGGCHATK